LLSTPVPAKKLKKKDLKKLEGKAQIFYFTTLEFAYDAKAFESPLLDGSTKNDLEEIITNLDTKLAESISVKKFKESIEKKYGVKINTAAFEMKFADRINSGLFDSKPEKTEQFTYYRWSVPSRNNRLIVSVYVFKLGDRIKVNKAQIEFKFLKLNPEKTAYQSLGSVVSDRITWKKPEDIYNIIKNNCFVK
jgi:hypothetical protein